MNFQQGKVTNPISRLQKRAAIRNWIPRKLAKSVKYDKKLLLILLNSVCPNSYGLFFGRSLFFFDEFLGIQERRPFIYSVQRTNTSTTLNIRPIIIRNEVCYIFHPISSNWCLKEMVTRVYAFKVVTISFWRETQSVSVGGNVPTQVTLSNLKKKVIYDCDPGIDDAFGLQFLLQAPDVEILAVTTWVPSG